MQPSRLRKKIRTLQQQIADQLQPVLARAPLLAASLYEHKIKCGKAQCKCATTAYRHHMWCLSYKEQGRSRTRVVAQTDLHRVRELTGAYRRLRDARARIQQACRELIATVDKLGRARCEQGQKRYARLAAQSKSTRSSHRGHAGGADS